MVSAHTVTQSDIDCLFVEYTIETIVGAKRKGVDVHYKCKWEGYKKLEDALEVGDPRSFLGDNLTKRRINAYWGGRYAWQSGIIVRYDKRNKKHAIDYDDEGKESLDLKEAERTWVLL